MISESAQALQHLWERLDKPPKYPFPWEPANELLFSLFEKEYSIIAARPSQGKTALITQLAWYLAMRNTSVLFLSLEMPESAIFLRVCSLHLQIPNHHIRFGKVTPEEREKMIAFQAIYEHSPFHVVGDLHDENAWKEIIDITQPEVVFLDHIQEMPKKSNEKIYESTTRNSTFLRDLCKRNKIPVVAACQINRSIKDNNDRRPSLEDLKGSGDMEQMADCVWLLNWPYKTMPKTNDAQRQKAANVKHEFHIDIAKNRNGATGFFQLHYQPEYYIFSEPL